MLLYLDVNCFNRPFDDQSQQRVADETEAVLGILTRVLDGLDEMVWSSVHDFENSRHPLAERRAEIDRWSYHSAVAIEITDNVAARAQQLLVAGFRPLDAAHLASAESAGAEVFLTCDDRLWRKAQKTALSVRVVNPRELFKEYSNG